MCASSAPALPPPQKKFEKWVHAACAAQLVMEWGPSIRVTKHDRGALHALAQPDLIRSTCQPVRPDGSATVVYFPRICTATCRFEGSCYLSLT